MRGSPRRHVSVFPRIAGFTERRFPDQAPSILQASDVRRCTGSSRTPAPPTAIPERDCRMARQAGPASAPETTPRRVLNTSSPNTRAPGSSSGRALPLPIRAVPQTGDGPWARVTYIAFAGIPPQCHRPSHRKGRRAGPACPEKPSPQGALNTSFFPQYQGAGSRPATAGPSLCLGTHLPCRALPSGKGGSGRSCPSPCPNSGCRRLHLAEASA
jgi:hypothetical protein